MLKTEMPVNISYTLLIHAGSYKDFSKKIEQSFPELKITSSKQKAIHYYIVQITDESKDGYKKENIYKLPIMGMKEEFSNYLFFKSVKAYNNVLKLMCDGKNNENAPYDLYQTMLTGLEKLKLCSVDNKTKKIEYTKICDNVNMHTSAYGKNIFNKNIIEEVFKAEDLSVDNTKIDFISILKKQKLKVGVI